MNIDTTQTKQPAFQANIKLKGFKFNDAEKFKAVQEIFSKKTQHYTDDVLEISSRAVEGDNGRVFYSADYAVNGQDLASTTYVSDLKDLFNNSSANDFAKTLSKIFKVGKVEELQLSKLITINKNLRSAWANRELNSFKLVNAKPESARVFRFQKLMDNNAKRIEVLEAQKAAIKEKYSEISNKIKGSSDLDIVSFWHKV